MPWLLTLLRRPRRAFTEGGESLLGAAMVVLAYGTAAVGIAVPALAAVESRLSGVPEIVFATETATIEVPSIFVGVLALGIVFGFLVWVFVAGLLHVGARIAGGTASFRRTLAAVGWGYVPNLFGTMAFLLVALVVVAVNRDASLAAIVLARDLPGALGEAPWYIDGIGLLDARTLLPALGTLWAGYIWLGALEVVQGLSRRRALVVVGLVVLLLLPLGDVSVVVRT